jgi:hypothetical protein
VASAVDLLAQRLLGHRLFTLMRLRRETMELERVYSSRPDVYPVGGRKCKRGLPWTDRVLVRGEVYVATTAPEMQAAFDDYSKLAGLGLGSVINTPVLVAGTCLGTMNLLHEPDWYRLGDERVTTMLSYLLAPAMLTRCEDRRE